jgi:RNA polymerase sigma factor (sigma-70 family)
MSLKNRKQYTNQSDEQLMIAIASGIEHAYEELYSRYSKPLYSFFYRMLRRDPEMASDQTQELFTKVYKYSSQFDPNKSFKTWLYSIANNQCKNEFAKMQVRNEAQMSISTTTELPRINAVDATSFKNELQKALEYLEEPKRLVFEMRYVQELSNSEIAEALNISEGTVKSRLFYAIKELKLLLAQFKEILTLILILFQI